MSASVPIAGHRELMVSRSRPLRQESEKSHLAQLREELEQKTYRADGVRRVWIPKPDGSERPLGIPTIRDRIVQMAFKLVVEPIFEADFCEHSYWIPPATLGP